MTRHPVREYVFRGGGGGGAAEAASELQQYGPSLLPLLFVAILLAPLLGTRYGTGANKGVVASF